MLCLLNDRTDTLQKRLMNSGNFVPNLLRCVCVPKLFQCNSFAKVIAKTKGAIFWVTV